ncbi:MAG: PAS domain-containing methyl-accepting chemotaxis protein [Pseudomonadaceae bacterium]
MRNNQPVSNRERAFADHEKIVSTTDSSGKIQYANTHFLDIAGYTLDEVVNQPHNLIRHPDMPAAAFKELWSTVKRGKPWMGIVKNRCKNGDYYWVDAFVTPILEQDKVVGFQSVRRKPSIAIVERAKRLYGITPNPLGQLSGYFSRIPLWVKSFFTVSVIFFTSIAILSLTESWVASSSAFLALSSYFLFMIYRPLSRLSAELSDLCGSEIAQTVYGGSTNEIGKIRTALHYKDSLKETVLWRIKEATDVVTESTDKVTNSTKVTLDQIQKLNSELNQVATAMHEMVATVCEVASNSSTTAGAAKESEGVIISGKDLLMRAGSSINDVKEKMDANMENINKLAASAEEIGKIVEVIKNIADQTNLLALNAAIEAARAGEQGRGFAVVADEVRHLAKETQDSTGNIQNMIEKLQALSQSSVRAVLDCQNSTKVSADASLEANCNMDSIQNSISMISDMSLQIATATEEQSAVSEEINLNVHNINNAAQIGITSINQVNEYLDELTTASKNLSKIIIQFGTV